MTVRHRAVRRQRGITLLGLLFWAIIIGFVALLGMRVIPTVIEYTTIQKAVTRIASEGQLEVSRANYTRAVGHPPARLVFGIPGSGADFAMAPRPARS